MYAFRAVLPLFIYLFIVYVCLIMPLLIYLFIIYVCLIAFDYLFAYDRIGARC